MTDIEVILAKIDQAISLLKEAQRKSVILGQLPAYHVAIAITELESTRQLDRGDVRALPEYPKKPYERMAALFQSHHHWL
jgi:hypothetical protein